MRKKILKLFLLIISFLLFDISVDASNDDYVGIMELGDIVQRENDTVCQYKHVDNDTEITFYLTKEEKQFFYKTQNGKNISFNAYETFKNGCPKYIKTTLIKENVVLSSGATVDMISISSTEYNGNKLTCGNVTGIPKIIPRLTSLAITIVQIAVPIILVIMGSLDLFKGITAGKEDEMKKGQQMFIKRLVLAAIIFFVVVIVKFLVSIVADTNVNNIVDCIDCFVSNEC